MTETQIMTALDVMVSYYMDLKKTGKGVPTPLREILTNIKEGYCAIEINRLRTETDEEVKKRLKLKLPIFTGSGTFIERKDEGIKSHSGIIIIDFDHLEDVERVREQINSDKYTLFSFVSCRGEGIAVGVKIDGEKHLESYEALAEHYKNMYGLIADQSCKDVSRSRFMSHDAKLFTNEESTLFIPKEKIVIKQFPVKANGVVRSEGSLSDEQKLKRVIEVTNRKHSYESGQRHQYLMKVCGFANKVGISKDYAMTEIPKRFNTSTKPISAITSIVEYCYKFTEEHSTCEITEQFLPKENEYHKELYKAVLRLIHQGKQWDEHHVENLAASYYVSKTLVRNILTFQYADKEQEFGLDNKSELDRVEVFLNERYDFRKDVVLQQVQFKRKGEGEFQPINPDSIFRETQKHGEKIKLPNLKSLLKSDFISDYDPLKEYFESLSAWDGKTDFIGQLSSYVNTDDNEYWKESFRTALIRMVSCALLTEYINRIILVLVSPKQNIGKSTFIRFLNPFKGKYYTEAPIMDNKDTEFRFAENFLYNIEELECLQRKEVNSLKAIISKAVVKERKPYAVDEIILPRRATLWGSTNRTEFLTDSENTRWMCHNVIEIDFNYSKEVDIDKVWSQVYALYMAGERGELSLGLKQKREESNKTFEVTTIESDLLAKYLRPAKKSDKDAEFKSVTEILQYLTEKAEKLKLNEHNLLRALSSQGFEGDRKRRGGRQVRGYYMVIGENFFESRPTPPPFDIGDLI